MAFLWTGSQIPVYIFGAIPPYIYADIGGADRWVWFVLAYLISLAGVCPFVGSLSDLLGRRYVALTGSLLIVIGTIVSSTAHSMNIFIGKFNKLLAPSWRNQLANRATFHSWNDSLRCGCWHCRADLSRRHLRTRPYSQTWPIRCHPRLHHPALLSLGSVGSTHRCPCRMEILRRTDRCMERCWPSRHLVLLLPTCSTQF